MSAAAVREQIRAAVDAGATFLITSATKPDGDSISAQLALRRLIRDYRGDVRVDIVNEVPAPQRYHFLPGIGEMKTMTTPGLLERYDVGITVDCSPERIGSVRPLYDRSGTRVTIDHHKVRTEGGAEINLVIPTASSTAEVIFGFVQDQAWRTRLDADLAAVLYTGIIFDTGGFAYKLTTPETHRIAARLLETGFDFPRVAERVLLVRSYPARMLTARILSTLRREAGGSIVANVVTQALMDEVGANAEDLEGLVEQLIFTEGAEVAVLAIELADRDFKFSLRSRGRIDVAALARGLEPRGGGHDRAAGCNLEGSADEVLELVIGRVAAGLADAEPPVRARNA